MGRIAPKTTESLPTGDTPSGSSKISSSLFSGLLENVVKSGHELSIISRFIPMTFITPEALGRSLCLLGSCKDMEKLNKIVFGGCHPPQSFCQTCHSQSDRASSGWFIDFPNTSLDVSRGKET